MAAVALAGMLAGVLAGCSTTSPPPGTIRARVESFTEIGGWEVIDAKTNPNTYMDLWIDARRDRKTVNRAHPDASGWAEVVVPAGTYGAVVVSKMPNAVAPGTGLKYIPCQASQTVHVRSRHVTSIILACPYYNDGYRMYPTRPSVPAPGVPDDNGIAHP